MLTETEELELIARAQAGDSRAEAALLAAFAPLVGKYVYKWRGQADAEDLKSVGNIGLLRAIRRFDPARGNRLATVAAHWILAAIGDEALRAPMIKIGTTKFGKGYHQSPTRYGLDGHVTDDQAEAIALANGSSVATVKAVVAARSVTSLDQLVGLDGRESLADTIADDSLIDPGDAIDEAERLEALHEALVSLRDRERAIVEARHLRREPAGLLELAERFGISRERVRQIEQRALEKLKEAFEWTQTSRAARRRLCARAA